ncbi:MAG: hypothetical protein GX033_05225 [Firmicutes bacterium]|nr:hypothetical protein [Bacillota bacterium]
MAGALRVFFVTALLSLIGNYIGFNISPLEALPGMVLLFIVVLLGYWLSEVSPIRLPSIAYISALAVLASIPGFPGADYFNASVAKVQFLALTTPVLAYTGISIGKDLDSFKRQGPKIVLVTILTFIGTYIGSAVIAEVILRLTGVI